VSSLPLERNPSKTYPKYASASVSQLFQFNQLRRRTHARTHARTAYRTGNITEFNARKSFSVSGVKFLNLTLVAIVVVVKCSHAMVRCSFFCFFSKKCCTPSHHSSSVAVAPSRTCGRSRSILHRRRCCASRRVGCAPPAARLNAPRLPRQQSFSGTVLIIWTVISRNNKDDDEEQASRMDRAPRMGSPDDDGHL
jgi:hypothetical protein